MHTYYDISIATVTFDIYIMWALISLEASNIRCPDLPKKNNDETLHAIMVRDWRTRPGRMSPSPPPLTVWVWANSQPSTGRQQREMPGWWMVGGLVGGWYRKSGGLNDGLIGIYPSISFGPPKLAKSTGSLAIINNLPVVIFQVPYSIYGRTCHTGKSVWV